MSFGSLSGKAIEALNRGAAIAGCLQNTGEGALSPHHRHGGDVVFQIGTSYFGCRDERGRFDLARLDDLVQSAPVRAIEIKLSQGAKPGLGGMLPGEKVSREIAEIRGIPEGVDCASPSRHAVFGDVDSMLDFVESVAQATGLPVGIKSAVGNLTMWDELTEAMSAGERGVDFVNIDGGEGGTGAAPLVFADSVAYPFRIGFAEVYRRFAAGRAERRRGLHRRRQARPPGERPRRLRAGRRHGQRRARGDAGHRVHPGPEVPHRPLPHRGRDAEPALHPGPRRGPQERACRQLRTLPASRPAEGLRGRRRRAPRTHRTARHRPPRRHPDGDGAGPDVWVRRLLAAAGTAPGEGDRGDHGRPGRHRPGRGRPGAGQRGAAATGR